MKEEEEGLDSSGPRGGEEKYTFRWQLPELGDWLHPQGKCGGVSETIPRFLARAPPPPPHLPKRCLHLPSQLIKEIECRQPSGQTIAALMLFLCSKTWR